MWERGGGPRRVHCRGGGRTAAAPSARSNAPQPGASGRRAAASFPVGGATAGSHLYSVAVAGGRAGPRSGLSFGEFEVEDARQSPDGLRFCSSVQPATISIDGICSGSRRRRRGATVTSGKGHRVVARNDERWQGGSRSCAPTRRAPGPCARSCAAFGGRSATWRLRPTFRAMRWWSRRPVVISAADGEEGFAASSLPPAEARRESARRCCSSTAARAGRCCSAGTTTTTTATPTR